MSESKSNFNQNNISQPIANTGGVNNPIASGNDTNLTKSSSYRNNTNINEIRNPQLKELLEELKEIINCSELEQKDKEDALEEVVVLVYAEDKKDNKLFFRADRRLKRITSNTKQLTKEVDQKFEEYSSR